ncbi:SWIM zinc finger family protein [Phycisphaera mikurensis]|uniref:SWIM-type domain-containing protein n=1 Tax=Phycisphaera mikurensis (strain NBRC 102666 / KCTC 22515 / FYK2301M01) TaxID=1142394 RepID=I0IJ48_PHYMF|nr:SWIM zinc finger family protein [Phycisphaera mikurensis]MBB6443133.1 putative Zn finger protein [Phycisphaera mikurensis]BAM05286.1 hypothetical protein PSMK_31270 [Phycisphaera mikurensis NBRC 102666]
MSYYGYQHFAPAPTVAQLRAKGERACAKLRKTNPGIEPVHIEGRTIARTFWGRAWCDNLEAYRDFAYRLERGRKYVRHRCVVDLSIRGGRVGAVVQGSSLYDVRVEVEPLPEARWTQLKGATVGQIGSAIDLLKGELSDAVIQRLIDLDTGLFPAPAEIRMSCSCPDGAGCCKHVAAALYGVGHRLDTKPDLLFVLRNLDPAELIAHAASADALTGGSGPGSAAELAGEDLDDIFGLSLGQEEKDSAPSAKRKPATEAPAKKKTKKKPAAMKAARKKPAAAAKAAKKKPSPKKKPLAKKYPGKSSEPAPPVRKKATKKAAATKSTAKKPTTKKKAAPKKAVKRSSTPRC